MGTRMRPGMGMQTEMGPGWDWVWGWGQGWGQGWGRGGAAGAHAAQRLLQAEAAGEHPALGLRHHLDEVAALHQFRLPASLGRFRLALRGDNGVARRLPEDSRGDKQHEVVTQRGQTCTSVSPVRKSLSVHWAVPGSGRDWGGHSGTPRDTQVHSGAPRGTQGHPGDTWGTLTPLAEISQHPSCLASSASQ